MVYIGSEAKWRLYYEGVKKKSSRRLELTRGTKILSAIFFDDSETLGRSEKKIKEGKKSRRENLQETPKFFWFLPLFGSSPRALFLYGYYLGGGGVTVSQSMCIGSRAYPHSTFLTVATNSS